MRVRWEYASLLWSSRMRNITRSDPEYERLPADTKRRWEQYDWPSHPWVDASYSLALPGTTETDTRHAWSTGEPEQGHDPSGYPVQTQTLLKRAVA